MAPNLAKLGALWEGAASQDQQIFSGTVVNYAQKAGSRVASASTTIEYHNATRVFHAHPELQHMLLEQTAVQSASTENLVTQWE